MVFFRETLTECDRLEGDCSLFRYVALVASRSHRAIDELSWEGGATESIEAADLSHTENDLRSSLFRETVRENYVRKRNFSSRPVATPVARSGLHSPLLRILFLSLSPFHLLLFLFSFFLSFAVMSRGSSRPRCGTNELSLSKRFLFPILLSAVQV